MASRIILNLRESAAVDNQLATADMLINFDSELELSSRTTDVQRGGLRPYSLSIHVVRPREQS
jgi:hypothetical protein